MLVLRGLKAWRMVLSKYPPEQIAAAIDAYDLEGDRDDVGPGLLYRYIEWGMEPEATLADVIAEALPSAADVRAERDPFTEDLYDEFMKNREEAHAKKRRDGWDSTGVRPAASG